MSWTLGRISGIWIRIHWTFALLPIWVYASSIMGGTTAAAAMGLVLLVLAVFGCILLHELGHAMAARQFGIATRDITLLPIGGVAALERMPRNPLQELWIAVAGPLVNVVIAVLLGITMIVVRQAGGSVAPLVFQLAIANVALVVFNLIPAFPMDGGRILRSILALMMDWVDATRIAVSVGKVAAVVFAITGFLSGNLMLILVGMFVFFAARSELLAATGRDPGRAFRTRSNTDAGVNSFSQDAEVPAILSMDSVAAWLANRKMDACRVVESGKTLGTVTREQLLIALARGLGNRPIGSLFR